jgi:hypothetical protein
MVVDEGKSRVELLKKSNHTILNMLGLHTMVCLDF